MIVHHADIVFCLIDFHHPHEVIITGFFETNNCLIIAVIAFYRLIVWLTLLISFCLNVETTTTNKFP